MSIWHGVASEFTWRPCGIMHAKHQSTRDAKADSRSFLEALSECRIALSVHYDARYGNMGGICMHARPDRKVGSPAGSPHSHLLNTTTPAVI
jgi:hypothetical protein